MVRAPQLESPLKTRSLLLALLIILFGGALFVLSHDGERRPSSASDFALSPPMPQAKSGLGLGRPELASTRFSSDREPPLRQAPLDGPKLAFSIVGAPPEAFPFQVTANIESADGTETKSELTFSQETGSIPLTPDWTHCVTTATSGPWFGRRAIQRDRIANGDKLTIEVFPSSGVSLEVRDPDGFPISGVVIASERRRSLDWDRASGWHYDRILLGQTGSEGRAALQSGIRSGASLFLYALGYIPRELEAAELHPEAVLSVTLAPAPRLRDEAPTRGATGKLLVLAAVDPLSLADHMPAVLWDASTAYTPISEPIILGPDQPFQCELESEAPGLLLCYSEEDATPFAFAPAAPGDFLASHQWTPIEESTLVGIEPSKLPSGATLATLVSAGRSARMIDWTDDKQNSGTWHSGCTLIPNTYKLQLSVGGATVQEFEAHLGPGSNHVQLPALGTGLRHLIVTVVESSTGLPLGGALVKALADPTAPLDGPVPKPIHAICDREGVADLELPSKLTALHLTAHSASTGSPPELTGSLRIELDGPAQFPQAATLVVTPPRSILVRVQTPAAAGASRTYRVALVRSTQTKYAGSTTLNERVALDIENMTTRTASFELQAVLVKGGQSVRLEGLAEGAYEVRGLRLDHDSKPMWCDILSTSTHRDGGLTRAALLRGDEDLEVTLVDQTRAYSGRVSHPASELITTDPGTSSPTISLQPLLWAEEGDYKYDLSVGPFVAPIRAGGVFDVHLPGPWIYLAAINGVGDSSLVQLVDLSDRQSLDLEFNSQVEISPLASHADAIFDLACRLALVGPDGVEMAWPWQLPRELSLQSISLPYTFAGLGPGMQV